MTKNIFYTAVLCLALTVPALAQDIQKVSIPEFSTTATLPQDRTICFAKNVMLLNEQVAICQNAKEVFFLELKKWIKQAENDGFIDKLEISSEKEDVQKSIDFLADYNYNSNGLYPFTEMSLSDAFEMLDTARKMALTLIHEDITEETGARKTSTPLDVFLTDEGKNTPSLFQKVFTNSLTAPYLQAVMKTIRLNVFNFSPLEDYIDHNEPNSDLKTAMMFNTIDLRELVKKLDGTNLQSAQDYYLQIADSNALLKRVTGLEGKYQNMLIQGNSSLFGDFGSSKGFNQSDFDDFFNR